MRLIRTLKQLLRTLRAAPRGGRIPARRPHGDDKMVVLSPGKRTIAPGEVEALGASATRRR